MSPYVLLLLEPTHNSPDDVTRTPLVRMNAPVVEFAWLPGRMFFTTLTAAPSSTVVPPIPWRFPLTVSFPPLTYVVPAWVLKLSSVCIVWFVALNVPVPNLLTKKKRPLPFALDVTDAGWSSTTSPSSTLKRKQRSRKPAPARRSVPAPYFLNVVCLAVAPSYAESIMLPVNVATPDATVIEKGFSAVVSRMLRLFSNVIGWSAWASLRLSEWLGNADIALILSSEEAEVLPPSRLMENGTPRAVKPGVEELVVFTCPAPVPTVETRRPETLESQPPQSVTHWPESSPCPKSARRTPSNILCSPPKTLWPVSVSILEPYLSIPPG